MNRYRFLLYVLAIALFAAYWEISDPEQDRTLKETPRGYPEVISTMYPERADSLFLQAMQSRAVGDLPRSRELFERAIATGVKTDENLYYEYLLTLIESDAAPADIERATELWRRNYPFSRKPMPQRDPQKAAAHP